MAYPVPNATPRKNPTIVLPVDQAEYEKLPIGLEAFRKELDTHCQMNPELLPPGMDSGCEVKDIYPSKKTGIRVRGIEIQGISYTVRPSFIMPHFTGLTDDVEKALFLRKFDVPYWALSHVFGKDPMCWHRMEQSLSGHSIVGTTVIRPETLPKGSLKNNFPF